MLVEFTLEWYTNVAMLADAQIAEEGSQTISHLKRCILQETERSETQSKRREDFCQETLIVLFKCSNCKTKELFVSLANSPLLGTLITMVT